MEVELMSELLTHFGIAMNIGKLIYEKLTLIKRGDIILDDFCNLIDEYRLVKPEVPANKGA